MSVATLYMFEAFVDGIIVKLKITSPNLKLVIIVLKDKNLKLSL
jgi:hypothetical protein